MLKKITYRIIAPIYDIIISRLNQERRRALGFLHFSPGEQLLIAGVGTGADLPFLPNNISIEGIDASPAMLGKAAQKKEALGMEQVRLRQGNAEALPYPDASFDKVILNLIVSVVDNPAMLLSEAVRVLRPGGEILVFDKFLPKGRRPGILRRSANIIVKHLGTDINRVFEDIIEGRPLRIIKEAPSWGREFFRIYLLEKTV
ncbi:MAG: methyltransferase domain-containing protein [Thermodesulfovibrionales bacterium]|jgi:ubiquinone/menaquinone biosynthesis C-methylase UbiE